MSLAKRQAAALFLPALAWALGFQVNYLLATSYCRPNVKFWMYVVQALVLSSALAGAYAGLSAWIEARSLRRERPVFLAVLGLASSALIALLAVAQWLPLLWLKPCAH